MAMSKKPRILTGKGSVTKNERMPELKKPNYRNPGGLDKPRVVKPRKTAVPMPIRTPVPLGPPPKRPNPKSTPAPMPKMPSNYGKERLKPLRPKGRRKMM